VLASKSAPGGAAVGQTALTSGTKAATWVAEVLAAAQPDSWAAIPRLERRLRAARAISNARIARNRRTSPDAASDVTDRGGGRGGSTDLATHDRVVAAITPSTLVPSPWSRAHRFGAPSSQPAPGLRDNYRVAADPVIWQEIFHANRAALLSPARFRRRRRSSAGRRGRRRQNRAVIAEKGFREADGAAVIAIEHPAGLRYRYRRLARHRLPPSRHAYVPRAGVNGLRHAPEGRSVPAVARPPCGSPSTASAYAWMDAT
jgi:hypothetical protein